ncbi:MAG: hypothetical protein AUI36_13785 [Cyanobacteria bacterium 13_1_40CM_2_61_4]|nr:MAG: hypothetical protein AUI36_13785 [Cyanobacteria bacterium 13_1_40CM_2_61_4]
MRSALLTLAGLRPEAIPNIIGKLKDPSPVARQNAAHVLGRLRWGEEPPSEARAIAPALAEALKDPEASVRREAAEALYFTGGSREAAVPALAELVGDPDPSVRKEALKALRCTGKETVELVHALAAGLQDRDPGARVEAALGFADRSRSPSGEEALKAIFLEALEASDPKARAKALEGLQQTSGREDSTIATFVRHLKDPDPEVRGSAALQLNTVGRNDPERAKAAVPALVEALADPIVNVCWSAAGPLSGSSPASRRFARFSRGTCCRSHLCGISGSRRRHFSSRSEPRWMRR